MARTPQSSTHEHRARTKWFFIPIGCEVIRDVSRYVLQSPGLGHDPERAGLNASPVVIPVNEVHLTHVTCAVLKEPKLAASKDRRHAFQQHTLSSRGDRVQQESC